MKPQAILFDMDGVLLDSEREWQKVIPAFRKSIGLQSVPDDVEAQLYGIAMETEHKILQERVGLALSLSEFIAAYDKFAANIYNNVPLAASLNEILMNLKESKIKLGIVTASVTSWTHMFLERLKQPFFDIVISISDTPNMKQKPDPDGYNTAMRILKVTPNQTLIIEDSNRGIVAGKASGATTLATSEFLDVHYIQKNYHLKISKLSELIEIIN